MEPLSPDVRERLMAQVANRPAPLRAEVLRRRLLLLALAAATVAGATIMRGVAWEGRPRMLTIVSVVVACAIAAVGTWWALVPYFAFVNRLVLMLGVDLEGDYARTCGGDERSD